MKIIIFGGHGFLGNNLTKIWKTQHRLFFSSRDVEIQSENQFYFDFNNPETFDESILNEADLIVNCIALSDVSNCESDLPLAIHLNIELPKFLARLCAMKSLKLVQISTDHFENFHGLPTLENNQVRAVNIYGKTKLQSEIEVLKICPDSIIARTNFFGHDYRKNSSLSDWLIGNLEKGKSVQGFTNILFNPVSIEFLATALIELVKVEHSGVVNISSDQCISKYDFLTKIARILNFPETLIHPNIYSSMNQSVARPNFMCLDNSYLKRITGLVVPSLDDMLSETFTKYPDWKSL